MRLKLILLLLLLASLARGQQQMSHEEQVVRTTYAKLSYADEVRIVMKTMNALPDKFQADERTADKALGTRLDFQLSNFTTGPISEIKGRIASELAGFPPEGDTQGILLVVPGTFNYKDNSAIGQGKTEWTVYVDVSWNKQPQHLAWGASNWPMAAILYLPEMNGPYDRYATYTVTVTFQSQSRTYNTAALFGKNPDGSDKVHFLDLISGGSAALTLDLLAKTDMSSAPFSKTDLRDVPFIRKWLNSNRQQACSVKGHGDVCCNPETKKCGIGTAPVSRRQREFRETSNPYLVLAGFHPRRTINPMMFQTSCSSFNVETFYNHGNGNTAGHVDGQHTLTSVVDGTCVYTAPAGSTGPGTCNSACSANATATPAEFGTLTGMLSHHVPGIASKSGQEGNTPTTQCQGTNAVSFLDCTFPSCTVTVSINGTANGVGAVVSFANASLWNDSQAAVHNCPAQSTTSTPTGGGGLPPDPCLNGPATVSGPSGDFGTTGGTGNKPDCSPIIVDLTGDGFFLTDAGHGVMFDIANTGIPIQLAWTANANNAFLVLDRNGSGTITDGAELFGNFTSQPVSAHPNGFAALAVYDDPMNGGNGDGVIDARDKIFSSLRLWVDANHDGISQPDELHTLPELGIYSISLDYTLSERKDQYGNLFRYRARVNQGMHGPADVGKTAYDVFLVSQ